jgi:hypothetical protein
MMGSARREPTAQPGLERHRRNLGFSPTPVLPILPSVDHFHCSQWWEASSLSWKAFSGGDSRFVFGLVTPHSPDDASHLVGQRDGRK